MRSPAAPAKREADRWSVSLAVEVGRRGPAPSGASETVGFDPGVRALATLSDGTLIPGSKALGRGLR